MSNDNNSAVLPQTNVIGHRTLKSLLLTGYSYQAQENSIVWSQAEREDRLRGNLDKLAEMQGNSHEQKSAN